MSHGQRRERLNPQLRYLLVLACGHWRQTAQKPTDTLYPCGRSRACQGPDGSTPRHVLRVVDLLAPAPTVLPHLPECNRLREHYNRETGALECACGARS